MFDFFISHSSTDKNDIVDTLVDHLKNMGYSIWYDKDEINAGDNIQSEVKNGLLNSHCLLIVITNNFFSSKWTLYETGFFNRNDSYRVIPLLYNVSEKNKKVLFDIIGNVKYIDMNTMSKEEVAADLARSLNKIKYENNDLHTIEKLKSIQKELAYHETINSNIISLKLNDYIQFSENNNLYLILAAKDVVYSVLEEILNFSIHENNKFRIDSNSIIQLINQNKIGNINFREHVKFILCQDSAINSYNTIKLLNESLLIILTYYIHTKYKFKLSLSKIEVVYPDELTYNDFVEMYYIDKKVMREDLIANVKTTYEWFLHNKYTHIAVKDIFSQKIVGYFSVLPITNDTYKKIISGDFQDKDFTAENIEQYIFSDFYKIYIAGVGIEPTYQNTGAFIKLYDALIDFFLTLAKEREIYISEVLAEASTKQGEKFCKIVGMQKISNTNNGTDIYRLITIPPEFRIKNKKGKELYNLCEIKFKEFKFYLDKDIM